MKLPTVEIGFTLDVLTTVNAGKLDVMAHVGAPSDFVPSLSTGYRNVRLKVADGKDELR
jgi:hypothetical protein